MALSGTAQELHKLHQVVALPVSAAPQRLRWARLGDLPLVVLSGGHVAVPQNPLIIGLKRTNPAGNSLQLPLGRTLDFAASRPSD
jgi:hypothetical protein